MHALAGCAARSQVGFVYPTLGELRADLLWLAAPSPDTEAAVRAAFDASVCDAQSPAVHSRLLPFMLDPVGSCPGDCSRTLAVEVQSVIAGFLTLAGCNRVGARLTSAARDALRTPVGTYTRACLDAAVAGSIPHRPHQPGVQSPRLRPGGGGASRPVHYGRLHGDASDSDGEVQLAPV